MHDEATDEELMFDIKTGDKSAFNELFNRYEGVLYRYLLRRCGHPSNAEELFQEVWEKVYRSRKDFLQGSSFRPYFFRIAHNHVVDFYRRQQKQFSSQQENDYSGEEVNDNEPHHMAEVKESHHMLLRELARLPQDQREVFILKEESGLSLNEVADVIGINYETAKSRLRYAVNKLQKRLINNEQ